MFRLIFAGLQKSTKNLKSTNIFNLSTQILKANFFGTKDEYDFERDEYLAQKKLKTKEKLKTKAIKEKNKNKIDDDLDVLILVTHDLSDVTKTTDHSSSSHHLVGECSTSYQSTESSGYFSSSDFSSFDSSD